LNSLANQSRRMLNETGVEAECVCPACRAALIERAAGCDCGACGREFPRVAGVPDFRLVGDRYLSLTEDRAKADRLARIERRTDLPGLAQAYYAMTNDVDSRRRDLYLEHIQRAEVRGAALADLLPREGRILEIGCGSGGLLAALARDGRVAVGVDIALRWLIIARRRLRDHHLCVPLVAACAESLPWADDTFDAVVADSVLEHIDEPAQALQEWRRVLRPSGRLVVWSPNRFTLLADPHVNLWGVGWLRHSWASAYVRMRRGCEWSVRPLAASEARRLAVTAGFADVRVALPRFADGAVRSELLVRRQARWLYGNLERWRASRALLLACGPLWQLSAVKKETR
jgi:SAM-dependent methyltransferase